QSTRPRVRPQRPDILLLIEVSDSSVDFDRSVKATLYAAAGVPELVDCRPDEGPARVLPLARTRWVPRCLAGFGGWARGAAGLPRGGTCRRRHSDALASALAAGPQSTQLCA